MKPREYQLLERCVEDGVLRGLRRAYKHTEAPLDTQIVESIHCNVMGEINEWFSFTPDEDCGR